MDARWMQRRVYGADHEDPDPGPRPGRRYVELVGGPLDGLLFDLTGLADTERSGGVALPTEIGAFGPGGRAYYGPRPGSEGSWHWEGDMP
ncbi:hypothetical protein AB0399_29405 [Streptomyces sp. NPDC088194]|uniref:hypothetical protein n=1 Tax=Streptomyces sp. NPDC088194 TaxID=3154931 RepID=UPI00344E7385